MHKVNLGKVPHHENEKYRIKLPDGVPRPPILGLYVAKRGQGKSTACVRLIKYYIDHRPEVFQKELCFIVSPTAESQSHLWNYMGVPEENVFVASTSTEVKDIIARITAILRSKKERHDEDQEYLIAYKKLMAGRELTTREEFLLEKREARPLEDPEPYPRPCLMLDDLSHLKVLDQK